MLTCRGEGWGKGVETHSPGGGGVSFMTRFANANFSHNLDMLHLHPLLPVATDKIKLPLCTKENRTLQSGVKSRKYLRL